MIAKGAMRMWDFNSAGCQGWPMRESGSAFGTKYLKTP
jgi:hypothetical protein